MDTRLASIALVPCKDNATSWARGKTTIRLTTFLPVCVPSLLLDPTLSQVLVPGGLRLEFGHCGHPIRTVGHNQNSASVPLSTAIRVPKHRLPHDSGAAERSARIIHIYASREGIFFRLLGFLMQG